MSYEYWRAKKLFSLASSAMRHASNKIRKGLPASVALDRAERLMGVANQAWLLVK